MSQSKNGNDWRFGMEADIDLDAASGWCTPSAGGTAGNVSDATQAHALLHVIKNLFRHRKTRYRG